MNNPWKTVDPRNNLLQTTHPLVKTWLTLLAKPKDLVLLSIYHLLHKYITPYFPTLSQPAFTSSKFTIETLEQFLFSHFYNLFYYVPTFTRPSQIQNSNIVLFVTHLDTVLIICTYTKHIYTDTKHSFRIKITKKRERFTFLFLKLVTIM